jgi:hypothetical protein
MSINNINNDFSAMFLQQPNTVQNNVRQISKIDERINFVENKIEKNKQLSQATKEMMVVNRQLSETTKEMMVMLKEKIAVKDKSIELNKDYIQTVKESREIDREIINIHERTINKLQSMLDRNSSKIDGSDVKGNSLIVIDSVKPNMPTSYKPSPAQLKTLTNQTNNDESKDIYIKNVRELGSSLIYRRTTFVPNTTPLIKEYKENYDDLILLRKELIPKIKSNEEIINKNKEILQNYSASITGEKIGSRKEENAIAILIEKNAALEKVNSVYINKMVEANNVYMDIIKIPLMEQEKINKADELLVNNKKSSASELYNQILISRPNSEKKVDENYRPLDEQLRQASKLYMSLQKIQNTLKIDLLSEKDLVVSCIAAHTTGKYSVSKNEVINMIDNGFFYSSID